MKTINILKSSRLFKNFGLLLLLFIPISLSAQGITWKPGGYSKNAVTNQDVSYEVNKPIGVNIISWSWTSSEGTPFISETSTKATINWSDTGTDKVLYSAETNVGPFDLEVEVTISIGLPNPPSIKNPYKIEDCDIILEYDGSPETGVSWYWQGTSAAGTATSAAASAATYTPTAIGTYYLRAKRDGTSQWSTSTSITITEMPEIPDAPGYNNPPTQPTCSDPNSGSITITDATVYLKAVDTSKNKYSIDDGVNWSNGKTFTGLAAGTYQLKVMNEDGCESEATEVVLTKTDNPDTPELSNLTITQPDCDTPDGTIEINLSGNLEYSFNDGLTFQESDTRSDLHQNTTYKIILRNTITGCESGSLSVPIGSQPSTPGFEESDITQVDPICGTTTGSITIANMGSGFKYSFDDGQNYSSSIRSKSNITAGTSFSLRVKNSQNCESDALDVTIGNVIPTPDFDSSDITPFDPICGSATGSITIANMGNGYEYSFDNGEIFSSTVKSLLNIPAGTVLNLKIKNSQGCESDAVEVTIGPSKLEPSMPTLEYTDATCATGTGSIEITAPIGASLEYSFDNGANYGDDSIKSDAAPDTDYQVKVRYKVTLCESLAETANIGSLPNAPQQPDVTITQPSCGITSATFVINNFLSTNTYTLNPGEIDITDANNTIAATGDYTLSVIANGCAGESADILIEDLLNSQLQIWYADEDKDGLRDLSTDTGVEDCSDKGEGWTTNETIDNCPGLTDASNPEPRIWYADLENGGTGDGFGDPNTPSESLCEAPEGYVDDNSDQCPNIYSTNNDCQTAPPVDSCSGSTFPIVQYTGDNYLFSRTYQTKSDTQTPFFSESQDLIQQITYFDGLGRPIQQIGINQSPDATGLGNFGDIITHIAYDDFGRMEQEFLPYATESGEMGTYRSDAFTKTNSFYASDNGDKYEYTTNPFSQKEFEPSPLNRITKQAAPGEAWKMNGGHEIEFDYQANVANEVRLFTVDLSGGNENPTLEKVGFYDANELYKNITKDENHTTTSGKNHTTEEFTDKQGRVVLKRTYADITNSDGSVSIAEPHDTYYVYDDFGNLTYVIPPLVNTANTISTTVLAQLCYQYKYDYRNRLIEKQIPGKEKEYIVYNKLDQPIMTQDANQRPNNEWLFTKYDAFGRVVYTGIYTHASVVDRSAMQTVLNDFYIADTELKLYENRDDTNTSNHNYSNTTFPNTGLEILTVNYYDSYVSGLNAAPDTFIPLGEAAAVSVNSINAKGLATGSKVKVLDESGTKWITSVSYYDAKGRPIYGYSENEYLATVDIMETDIDFIGKPLKTRSVHSRTIAGTTTTIVTIDNFQYDQTGRLLAQTQCVGDATLGDSCGSDSSLSIPIDPIIENVTSFNEIKIASSSITVKNATLTTGAHLYITDGNGIEGEQELIVFNSYDNLGQLKNKKVGGDASAQVQQSSGLQQIDYKYNVRGWLTDINDITDASPIKLFNFSIGYNQGANPLFNGNISQIQWRTDNADSSLKSYDYAYDPLNRITSAIDDTSNFNLANVTYDKNGNIMTLNREGHIVQNPILGLDENNDGQDDHFGLMDELTYAYTGNQLQSVTDFAESTGFKDGNISSNDYGYDTNGNMISDGNKGITDITYNHLNLPERVTVAGSDEGSISYIYAATGVKLQKNVLTNVDSNPKSTDYAGNYIYENGTLQFFRHAEGYVSNDNGSFKYVYEYRDHLDNVRLSYTDANNDGNVDQNEVVKESNYYPFGLEHKGYNSNVSSLGNSAAKNYKFNGKEHQQELGLNLYHYGARFYDPAIGQFTTIDPKAESYGSQGGYVYAVNNPIAFHEKNGENPIFGVLRWITGKATKYATRKAVKVAQKKALKKSQKSLKENVKKHIKKEADFMKDPIKNSGDDAIKQMTKDNPTKDVLLERAKGRGGALAKQTKKNQGELNKVTKQLKELNKTSDKVKTGTVAAVTNAATKKAVSAATPDVDATINVIKTITTLPGQVDTRDAANLGKNVIGDNAVGRFVDEWVNPFGIVDDLKTLMIIGIMSTSDE